MRYLSSMAHREDFKFAAEVADGCMSVFCERAAGRGQAARAAQV